MSSPVWSEKEGRWVLRVYANRKCIKKFTSTKHGTAGRNEVLRKRSAFEGGQKYARASVADLWQGFVIDVRARYCPEGARNIEIIGNNNILPAVGGRRVTDLSVNAWQRLINDARKQNGELYSKRYYKTIRNTVAAFLRYCQRDGLAVADASLLYTPKNAPKKEKAIITPEVARRLFDDHDAIASDYFIHFYRFLYLCGLRPSEACGLQWTDIKGDRMTIQRAITRTMRITEGKTENARRVQFLPDAAINELKAQKALTASLNSPWVFPNFSGGALCQDLAALHWRRIRQALGCPEVALYNFRHTYITNLAAAGLPLISLKSLVGHSASMPTLDIYGHTTDDALRSAQTALNDIYSGLR